MANVEEDDEAFQYFLANGEHMGIYASQAASDAAGSAIHLEQVAHPPIKTGDFYL